MIVIGRDVAPDPVDTELTSALNRYLATKGAPLYLRDAAAAWFVDSGATAELASALRRIIATASEPRYLDDAGTAWLKERDV